MQGEAERARCRLPSPPNGLRISMQIRSTSAIPRPLGSSIDQRGVGLKTRCETCRLSAHCSPASSTRVRLSSCLALSRAATARQTIGNGFRFKFQASSDVLSSIVRMIDAERQCCQFLRFQLTVEAAGGQVVLDVTGPAGSQEFFLAILAPV